MLVFLTLFSAGCGGINAGTTVSPADFLLPGVGHCLKADPSPTNAPGSSPEISKKLLL